MKCVDLYEYERTIWVFLEHLEYGSLAQIVQTYYTKYSEDFCKYILFKVCSALDAMHQQNVLHRDIKIDHVFCGQSGDVKLADLGLQIFFNQQTKYHKERQSQPHQMAPEVIKGASHQKETDIWALGCLAYELATGKKPFHKAHSKAKLLD